MKIYRRRNFAAGILCLLLAVGCGVLMIREGFQVKLLVSLTLLLFLGGVDIAWSLSREARLPRADERDRKISEKSAWGAYLLLTNGCFFVSLPLLVIYGFFRMPVVLAVALTLDCVVLAAFVLLIGTNLYYERRM